jgi:integrase
MFFDARAAKLLQPGQHIVIDGCMGLRLVASASRRTWIYRFKSPVDGKMKQTALGQWPALSAQVAVSQWQALRDQRASGVTPVTQRKAARRPKPAATAVYTVRALMADYVAGHLKDSRKPAGAAAAGRLIDRALHQHPDFASVAAASVTRGVAFDVLDSAKATPTIAAKLRSLLGAGWDYALDAGRIDGNVPNWWRVVMRGRLKSKGKVMGGEHQGQQRRVLQPAEVAALLAWLPNMHALGRDAVVMYLWTCARGSEILAMRPEHVTQEGNQWWWTVPKSQTKNAKTASAVDLRVPLCGQAMAVVQRRIASVGASGHLFEDTHGKQYSQHSFGTYIYSLMPYSPKVKNRQGEGLVLPVTHWSAHDLRRTGRTLLAGLGCPNEVGEAILGHVPANIIGVYNAYKYDAERVLWLGKLSAYLSKIANHP